MPLPRLVQERLLGSIEAHNLVLLCGAGLSIPDPSKLMSAVAVARRVYDEYAPTLVLPAPLREDIDKLAGHFLTSGQFEPLFINRLVPWDDLTGEPNDGHAAVGDFLLSGAARAALSANFDLMIEQWSSRRKVQLRGALDGIQATAYADATSPLLKFHGCMQMDRERTLWTQGQLALPEIQRRVDSCKAWMQLNLPGRDLLVVGFWTDWCYFNDVLAEILGGANTSSVSVIDPQPAADLMAKAPTLWATLSALPNFVHVPQHRATKCCPRSGRRIRTCGYASSIDWEQLFTKQRRASRRRAADSTRRTSTSMHSMTCVAIPRAFRQIAPRAVGRRTRRAPRRASRTSCWGRSLTVGRGLGTPRRGRPFASSTVLGKA